MKHNHTFSNPFISSSDNRKGSILSFIGVKGMLRTLFSAIALISFLALAPQAKAAPVPLPMGLVNVYGNEMQVMLQDHHAVVNHVNVYNSLGNLLFSHDGCFSYSCSYDLTTAPAGDYRVVVITSGGTFTQWIRVTH